MTSPILDLHPMNWNQAIDHNPVLCFAIIATICLIGLQTSTMLFRIISRVIRFFCVSFRGWPPQHLDADGNFRVCGDTDGVSSARPLLVVPWGDCHGYINEAAKGGWVLVESHHVTRPMVVLPDGSSHRFQLSDPESE
jgi:hypothetical protein